MGSVVTYRCKTCNFSSGDLRIGWGKRGRAGFWGGLVRCEPCGAIATIDLASRRDGLSEDPRCETCGGLLSRLEGTSVHVSCPRCRRDLQHLTIGTWD